MPSMSGGALRLWTKKVKAIIQTGFYALDVGRGFATSTSFRGFLTQYCFYALDVGRGFATDAFSRYL